MNSIAAFLVPFAWITFATVGALMVLLGVVFYRQWRLAGMSRSLAHLFILLYAVVVALLAIGLLGAVSTMSSSYW